MVDVFFVFIPQLLFLALIFIYLCCQVCIYIGVRKLLDRNQMGLVLCQARNDIQQILSRYL